MLLYLKLCLFLLLVSSYSKANTCLPDHEGLCTPETIIDEQVTIEKTEEDKGEIILPQLLPQRPPQPPLRMKIVETF